MWQIRYWTRDGEGVVKNLTRDMAERVAASMRTDIHVWDIHVVEQGEDTIVLTAPRYLGMEIATWGRLRPVERSCRDE